MTQVLRSLLAEPALAAPAAGEVALPAPSAECVRLALRLRDMTSPSTGRVLLFVPAATGADAARLVHDAAAGLLGLREGPLLVMDLRTTPDRAIYGMRDDDEAAGVDEWDTLPPDVAAIARPFAARTDTVAYAASTEFAAVVDRVRRRYAFVLCIGEPVHRSVETLIAATRCDAVVLAVTPGRTTRSDVLRTTEQLRRSRANVAGFVVEPGTKERKG